MSKLALKLLEKTKYRPVSSNFRKLELDSKLFECFDKLELKSQNTNLLEFEKIKLEGALKNTNMIIRLKKAKNIQNLTKVLPKSLKYLYFWLIR